MAIDPKKLQEVQDSLKEIEKIYKTIGQTNPLGGFKLNTIKDIDQTLQDVNDELDKAQIKLTNWEDSVSGIYNSFKSIVSEISKSSTGINASKKALNASSKVAAELRDYHMGISKLSVKEIQNQKEKLLTSQQNLKSAQNILQEEETRLINGKTIFDLSNKERSQLLEIRKALKANNRALQDKDKLYAQTLADLEAAEETETKINKQLGLTGGLLKGISKIPILGDVFDANEAVGEMDEHLRKGKSSVSALGVGFKNIGKQIIEGALNPSNLVLGAFTLFIKALIQGDKQVGEMAKSLNLTYQEANQVRGELTQMAKQSEYTAITTSRLSESLSSINSAFGTTAKISKENLETFSLLRDTAGMTNEEIISLYGFSKLTGKELKDSTESFQASAKAAAFQSKVAINTKKLMADISKTSKRFQLSIEGGEAGLAKAMVNAKLLGVEMSTIESIADSLLNFESSITSELEAELLLGRDINLEKAREAALSNDLATLASEIKREAGSAAEFNKMNRIQQEAIAKAVGMTASGLSDALFEQEALASLGRQLNSDEKRAFETLKEKYGVEEATRRIKDGQLESLVAQQSTAEQFQDVLLKVQEIFVAITEPVLGLVNGIMDMVGGAENLASILKTISGLYITLKAAQIGFNLAQKVSIGLGKTQKALTMGEAAASIVKGSWSSVGVIPIVGAALAAAAIGGGIAYLYSQTSKAERVNDGIIGPGGKTILSGPEGTIQLNDKDSIVAGTNLFGDGKKQQPTQSQPSTQPQQSSVDMTQTNALLQQLISVIQSGGTVTLDGQKVGTALKLGTYQVQ